GDAGVLADEVLLLVRNGDVAVDHLEHAPAGGRRLLVPRSRQRVAQVLRDVLQRPHIEVRRGILDRALEIHVGNSAPALALSAARRPPRRPTPQPSSREFPITRLRRCVPPAISPQAKGPPSVVSACSSITRPPFW